MSSDSQNGGCLYTLLFIGLGVSLGPELFGGCWNAFAGIGIEHEVILAPLSFFLTLAAVNLLARAAMIVVGLVLALFGITVTTSASLLVWIQERL
jgi:hypothetical protein